MALIAEMGVIATEVKQPRTISHPNGRQSFVTDFPVFFNDYVPGVGNTTFTAIVSLWDDKANWIYAEAQKHKKKDNTLTKGKGMPMFFIGHAYTDTYNGRNGEVTQTKISGVDVLYTATPVFQSTGVIGAEVKEPRKVNLKNGGTNSVLDIPVFFNGYVPGVKNTALETYVTLWGDRADWLYEKAQKHTKKDNTPTKGKGMAMDFICYPYTDKYTKDGAEIKQVKVIAADVKFPQSVFGASVKTENTTAGNTQAPESHTPPVQEPMQEPMQEPSLSEPIPENDPFANMSHFQEEDPSGIMAEFDLFLQDIGQEGSVK